MFYVPLQVPAKIKSSVDTNIHYPVPPQAAHGVERHSTRLTVPCEQAMDQGSTLTEYYIYNIYIIRKIHGYCRYF